MLKKIRSGTFLTSHRPTWWRNSPFSQSLRAECPTINCMGGLAPGPNPNAAAHLMQTLEPSYEASHISKFTMKLDVPWNFTRDTRRTVEFHVSKFPMKLAYPGISRLIRVESWNFVWENLEWRSVSCNISCMRVYIVINALVDPHDSYVVRRYFRQIRKTK